MAIAEMHKFNLVAMSYDKDAILNALQKTGAVEVKLHAEAASTVIPCGNPQELQDRLARVEAALSVLSAEVEEYNANNKIKSNVLKDGFEVSYSEFMAAGERGKEADVVVARIEELSAEKNEILAEAARLKRTLAGARIYSGVTVPLGSFADTLHTRARLGTLPAQAREELVKKLEGEPLIALKVLAADAESALIFVVSHKTVAETADAALSEAGFTDCPFAGECTGEELYASLKESAVALERKRKANEYAMYELNDKIQPLKVYCDRLGFQLEKERLSDKLRATERTFLLEAYVPKDAEEEIKGALSSVTGAAYYEFSEPSAEETPPTLLRNNKVVKNFESVTNLYSVPNYREFDPNTVMSVFYSIFLGFIMGDVGYGLLMLLGGGFIWYKNKTRDSELKRLSGVFAVGGIFAIVWGILFNSFFGIALPFMNAVMPDAQGDMWSFSGIGLPSVLLISLLVGLVQIFAGYICRAVQEWRRGNFWDGVWNGIVWAVFSVGVGLAVVGFIEEAGVPVLAKIGAVIALAALIVAVLTAGRKEKFLGKFSKGFGAVYGVINYISDVLSYSRLYGLMLSGAVIAQIISQYSIQFVTGGNIIFAALGIVIMLVGHVFNLAIGLLGAYIHDARLQYVEFYGRFFEGDGELFAPLGSQHKYISLTPSKQS